MSIFLNSNSFTPNAGFWLRSKYRFIVIKSLKRIKDKIKINYNISLLKAIKFLISSLE